MPHGNDKIEKTDKKVCLIINNKMIKHTLKNALIYSDTFFR